VTVLGIAWQSRKLSKKKTTKVLVVSFSGALDKAAAQTLGDYHLISPGKAKKSRGPSSKPVPLTSATYDPALHTVTLTPGGKRTSSTLQLTINAAGTLDSVGRPIDGNRDGQPGGDVVATFGNAGIRLARASPAGPSGRVSAQAFDALIVAGRLTMRRGRPGL
jgi:hypothetical protein